LLVPAQPPAPGFAFTLDGGVHQQQRITLKPLVHAGYCNNYWNTPRDPRGNRLLICSDGGTGGPELLISLPASIGPFVFDKSERDNAGRNPYLFFELAFDKYGVGQRMYETEHIEVVLTRIDPPGGRIEGTFRGTLLGPQSAIVTVTGMFSVVREKDRVVQ
jgi:hypothetical protein